MATQARQAPYEVCASYGPGTGYFVIRRAGSLEKALHFAKKWKAGGGAWLQKYGRPAVKRIKP